MYITWRMQSFLFWLRLSRLRVFSGLVVALALVWLVVEVSPGTLLNPAKKLDEAEHPTGDDASPNAD